MKIKVIRETFTENSTIGRLYINDAFQCFTIEDKDRGLTQAMSEHQIAGIKVHGKTAIPYGTYDLAMTFSNRFQAYMPQILNVKGFEGIRIHPANKATELEGCIATGETKGKDFIGMSKAAYAKFLAQIKKVEKTEKITIEIIKGEAAV